MEITGCDVEGRTMKRLTEVQQVMLFQYICEKGLPPWAKGDSLNVFARLLNLTTSQAKKIYEQAVTGGYLGRR